jgi:hypothetical protein
MRDVNGLEILNSGNINGVIHTRQTMLMGTTQELHFEDQTDITDYFTTLDQKYINPNTRCIIQIGLRYAWDGEICPDFKIVVQVGKLSLISKQGLDDYPLTVNSADMSVVVLDTTNMRILLTKSDANITKFSLLANSFIKIDVV